MSIALALFVAAMSTMSFAAKPVAKATLAALPTPGPFQIIQPGDTRRDLFLLDTQTGRVWRSACYHWEDKAGGVCDLSGWVEEFVEHLNATRATNPDVIRKAIDNEAKKKTGEYVPPPEPKPMEPPKKQKKVAARVSDEEAPANCTGDLAGRFQRSNGNAMTLDDTCQYKYTGTNKQCTAVGVYEPGQDAFKLHVTKVKGKGNCLPVGDYDCEYELSDDELAIDCGKGAETFRRS
jgi:hypothetical protein